jgi:hypothetical protein
VSGLFGVVAAGRKLFETSDIIEKAAHFITAMFALSKGFEKTGALAFVRHYC